jgi:hypothetical protein
VLLEGDTELGALPIWFEKSTAVGIRPSDLDIAFFSVDGDRNFRVFLTVLQALAIPWVLICDGAAFDHQNRKKSEHIFRQVLDVGVDGPDLEKYLDSAFANEGGRVMSQEKFDEQVTLGQQHGVFTLDSSWIQGAEGFEVFVDGVFPGKLSEATSNVGKSKVRVGRWIAENSVAPQRVVDTHVRLLAHLNA